MIILKNGEKSIVTIKAKVKSLVGQNDDITIEIWEQLQERI